MRPRSLASRTVFTLAASVFMWALPIGSVPGQGGSPSLREYFLALAHNPRRPGPLAPGEWGRLSDQLRTGSRAEISDALPAIFAATEDKNAGVRGQGALALVAISLRPDRHELLSKHLPALTSLISSDDPRVVLLIEGVLATVWPQPPPEVLPSLLEYLRRPDTDTGGCGRAPCRARAAVLQYVVGGAAENPEVSAAVAEYWSRPLDKGARIAALEALSNSHSTDSRIIDLVESSLEDADFEVRLTAFQATRTMSNAALEQARAPMQKAAREYLELVKRRDVKPDEQVSVIQQLVLYEPNDPGLSNALVEYLSRPLDTGTRLGVLDALREPRLKDPRLMNAVIDSLRDPSPMVRSDAAYVLADMGPEAVARARPDLLKLSQDRSQPPEVESGVRKALGQVR